MALRPPTAALMTSLLMLGGFMSGQPALAGAKPTPSRIYKVDNVIATNKGKLVVIQANGAVQTGGWRHAKLHLLHNDGHTLTFEFLADPPPPDMTVIDALVPMKAMAEVRIRHPIISVRVQADANEVTAQVLR
jgi:hypothetical protein